MGEEEVRQVLYAVGDNHGNNRPHSFRYPLPAPPSPLYPQSTPKPRSFFLPAPLLSSPLHFPFCSFTTATSLTTRPKAYASVFENEF